MLVREADVGPKSFICPASDDQEFKLSEEIDMSLPENSSLDITQLWDFGPYSGGFKDGDGICHNSYSYQQPYRGSAGGSNYSPTGTGNASKAILADKSPYGDSTLTSVGAGAAYGDDNWKEMVTKIDYESSTSHRKIQLGNSALHDREGQNVLFNDGHAEFTRRPDVSINNDNIYTSRITPSSGNSEIERRVGNRITDMLAMGFSNGAEDTVLVHDDDAPE